MQTHIPDNCGNSPRSLIAIEIAISLAAHNYQKLEHLLADDFTLSTAGGFSISSPNLTIDGFTFNGDGLDPYGRSIVLQTGSNVSNLRVVNNILPG